MALVFNIEKYRCFSRHDVSDFCWKEYVECMLRQLVVWRSIARVIIYSKGSVQAVATDRKWQSLR